MHTKIEQARKKVAREQHTLEQIIAGLQGQPFRWAEWEYRLYGDTAKDLGLTLISATRIKKDGYMLKQGQAAVGSAYFGAPIQKHINLYILEVQCKPKSELRKQAERIAGNKEMFDDIND